MFPRGLSGLSWDQDFCQHKSLLEKIPNHILHLLAKFHWNQMKRFQIMPKKPHFYTNPYNSPDYDFFQKNKNVIFFTLSSYNFVPKIRKFLWTDFQIFPERTNERPDERRLNHKSQLLRGGPKRGPNGSKIMMSEF